MNAVVDKNNQMDYDHSSLQEDSTITMTEDDANLVVQGPQNHQTRSLDSMADKKTVKLHTCFLKKNKWKLTFFASVLFTLVLLNILFAPMMKLCSATLIAKL